MRTLCLGEALVELISARPIEAFVPRFGGAVANVAVVAARLGARVALAGAAGDDEWGEWLRETLRREGVDDSPFVLVPETQTQLRLAKLSAAGEPVFATYAERVSLAGALGERMGEGVRVSAALLISSHTLEDVEARELTMRARSVALELGRPVIFYTDLCADRWRSHADAAAGANACVPGALLVCASDGDATLMTGEEDPERAAMALVKAGARLVVIMLGPEGALLRGELRADVDGEPPAKVISTIGAGDVLAGTLLGRLALSDFYPAAAAAALPEAVRESARALERWGALD